MNRSNNNRGQLWVIDGADGVGKATQVELLVKRLNDAGTKTHHISFPHYQEKPWGALTRQYLDGVFGPLDAVGPYPTSLLYAADRGQHAAHMHEMLKAGDWIICDRFTPSNAAFQAAKIKDLEDRQTFIDWLFKTEYELFNVPKPDGVIILTMPVEVTYRRTEVRRNEAKARGDQLNDKVSHTDIHEQNTDYMSRVMEQYISLAKQFGWHIIDCAPAGKELSREEISRLIWNCIRKNQAT